MITLIFELKGEVVRVNCSSDITTNDLLEVMDTFIKTMGREPCGSLDYVTDELSK